MRRTVFSLVTTTLVGSLALSACGGSDGPTLQGTTPLAQMTSAVDGTDGATITGRFTPTTGEAAAIEGSWIGHTSVGTSGALRTGMAAAGRTLPFEARWLDSTLYVHRTTSAGDTQLGATLPFVVRPAGGAEWGRTPLGGLTLPLLDPYVVPALLERLTKTNVVLDKTASGTYKSKAPTLLGLDIAGAIVEITVDGSMRPTRVSVHATKASFEYTVSWKQPAAVEAPPEAQTGPLVPVVEPARPVGEFTPAASGTDGGAWSLERADGTKGTTCWRVTATPTIALNGTDAAGVRCIAAIAADADPADTVVFVAENARQASRDFAAVVFPKGAHDLVVGYVGGRTAPAAVPTPITTPFVMTAPLLRGPAYLAVTLSSGEFVECGRGAIGIASDLSDSNLTGSIDGTPWTCAVN